MDKTPEKNSESSQKNTPNRQVKFVTVDATYAGQRIDNFLLRELKDAPRSYVYRILRKGEVRVNKKRAKPSLKIKMDDVVRIPPVFLPEKPALVKASDALLSSLQRSIILEDDDVIVIDKPSGLAVHGGSGVKVGLIEGFRQLRSELPFLELVHRLDKETSGIIILAKNRAVLLELHEMLKHKSIDKFYQTLVLGKWQSGPEHVKNALLRQQGNRNKIKVVKGNESSKAKLAESIFTPLETYSASGTNYSLIKVELLTGRMHQIRTQLSDRGLPILGDSQYGDFSANRKIKKEFGLKRLFLHAYHLRFKLKSSGKLYDIKIPLANDLNTILERLK